MRTISNALPTTHAVRAIQHSWLATGGTNTIHIAVLLAVLVTTTFAWVHVARRTGQ